MMIFQWLLFMLGKLMGASIQVNGQTYTGNSVSIRNGNVIIDGKKVDSGKKRELKITVEGHVDKLEVDHAEHVWVNGGADSVKTMSGDVEIKGDIKGSVKTMSGDVECTGKIGGSVSTMSGDITSGS